MDCLRYEKMYEVTPNIHHMYCPFLLVDTHTDCNARPFFIIDGYNVPLYWQIYYYVLDKFHFASPIVNYSISIYTISRNISKIILLGQNFLVD